MKIVTFPFLHQVFEVTVASDWLCQELLGARLSGGSVPGRTMQNWWPLGHKSSLGLQFYLPRLSLLNVLTVRSPSDEKQVSLKATWNDPFWDKKHMIFLRGWGRGMEVLSPHLSACSLPGGGRVFATSPLWSRVRLLLVSGQSVGIRILIYSFFSEEVS